MPYSRNKTKVLQTLWTRAELANLGAKDLFNSRKLLKTPESFGPCRLSLVIITSLEKLLKSVNSLKIEITELLDMCQMSTS